jgi:hypothetical protein
MAGENTVFGYKNGIFTELTPSSHGWAAEAIKQKNGNGGPAPYHH